MAFNLTTAPPAGAAWDSTTEHWPEVPPTGLELLQETDDMTAGRPEGDRLNDVDCELDPSFAVTVTDCG